MVPFEIEELEFCLKTGRSNAVKEKVLAQMMDTSRRRVRKIIEIARNNGIPVIADGHGYFIADLSDNGDRKAAVSFYNRERAKALTLLRNLEPLRRKLEVNL